MIDLFLAGDNAIVIGMAARNLPAHQQKKAIIWGTGGAIVIRILSTIVVVWLLNLTGLKLVGGLMLVYIAYKLLVDKKSEEHVKADASLGKAIATIIVADAAMGLDNVIAVAGAADESYLLVVLGLLISIPIMVYGSTLVIKFMDRFPWLIYVGSAILAWTAAKMITEESFIHDALEGYAPVKWLIVAFVLVGTLAVGRLMNKRQTAQHQQNISSSEAKHHSASA
jgi:YjbE family integral membrane protein